LDTVIIDCGAYCSPDLPVEDGSRITVFLGASGCLEAVCDLAQVLGGTSSGGNWSDVAVKLQALRSGGDMTVGTSLIERG